MRAHKIFTLYFIPLLVLTTIVMTLGANKAFAGLFDSSSGEALPKFSVPTLSNTSKQLTNKSLQGRVSLLNVWASWCGYCLSEHPTLMQIKNTSHVPIYGLNFRDNPDNAREFLKKNGNPYVAVGVDWSGEVGAALGVSGTPQTFIIDKHGMIRDHYSGSLDASRWQTIAKKVKQYEAEK